MGNKFFKKDLESRVNPKTGKVKKKNKEPMEEVIKNAKDLHKTRQKIINMLKDEEETKDNEKIQKSDFDWLFKKENDQEELKKFNLDVGDVHKKVKDDSNLKYIPPTLTEFVNKILPKDIDSLEKATKKYDDISIAGMM